MACTEGFTRHKDLPEIQSRTEAKHEGGIMKNEKRKKAL
jgi:hypothetical protein